MLRIQVFVLFYFCIQCEGLHLDNVEEAEIHLCKSLGDGPTQEPIPGHPRQLDIVRQP